MPDEKQPTTAEIVIMAAGGVALVGSFLNFYPGVSAWGSGLFPIATLMALFAFVMGLQIALRRFAGVAMPERVVGFTWSQIHLILGFFATLYAVAFLISDLAGGSRKIGFWVILIGCIGALVGAILLSRESTGTSTPPPAA